MRLLHLNKPDKIMSFSLFTHKVLFSLFLSFFFYFFFYFFFPLKKKFRECETFPESCTLEGNMLPCRFNATRSACTRAWKRPGYTVSPQLALTRTPNARTPQVTTSSLMVKQYNEETRLTMNPGMLQAAPTYPWTSTNLVHSWGLEQIFAINIFSLWISSI